MCASSFQAAPYSGLIRPDLHDYCPASNLEFNNQVKERIANGEDICHLAFGQSPFPVPELAQKGLREHCHEHAYLSVPGLPKLRSLICEMHRDLNNTRHFSEDSVLMGPGSKEIIFLVMNVFNGDIFVNSPTWTTYLPQTKLAGNKAFVIPKFEEDGWKLKAKHLEEGVIQHRTRKNALLIFCSPDNPTGVSHNREELQQIAEVCRRLGLIVIADEIYAWTHFEQKFSSLAEFYPEGTIVTSGFSKWSSAGGWRVGYGLFPQPLRELYDAVRSAGSHTYSCAAAPMQHALIKFLSDRDGCLDYMRHTSRILAAVAEFVRRSLTSVGVSVVPADATFYVMPNFEVIRKPLTRRGITTGASMCDLILKECRVALMSGGPAFLCKDEDLTVRLCFVDFEGAPALEESRRLGLESALPENFVEEYCKKLHQGIQRLCRWVSTLTEGSSITEK